MNKLHDNAGGVAHLALIVVGVVVLAGVGFAAYRVTSKDKQSSSDTSQTANVPCESDDKDLCKFFSSWKASTKYRLVSTAPDGKKSTFEIDGNKNRISMAVEAGTYEVITIDKTTYTKAGSTWYKQTAKSSGEDLTQDYKIDLEEPKDEGTDTKDQTTYKKIGKEACGNLTCFKYEVVNPATPDVKQYIWFDDNEYQLRRTRTENKEGATEMTFEYSGITVSEPSPVKELAPNQVIIPGQSEPMTLPTAP